MLKQATQWRLYVLAIVLLLMVSLFNLTSAQSTDADDEQDTFSLFLPLIKQAGELSSDPVPTDSEGVIFTDSEVSPIVDDLYKPPVPLILREGVQPVTGATSQADIQLSPLDVKLLQQEDNLADKQKNTQRVGVVRPLSQAVTAAARTALGTWRIAKDGRRFWTLTIESPGAQAIRVHLEDVHLPLEAQVIVYNTANPQEAYGPYTVGDFSRESDLWTASVFGSMITLELAVSANVESERLFFAVRELSHLYVNPAILMQPMEGSCHNDVTCHASWSTESRAVARYTFIKGGSTKLCSGALLKDLDAGTFEDYFLTANHCVGTQAVASTAEFYWLYQTSTCDGTPPGLGSVPRTNGGADLLSTSGANDHSLLRIRNAAPSGLTYLGWTRATLSDGQDLVGIHHPTGAYKRISFGDLRILLFSNTNFWTVVWHDGVTEPGSSGSPLLDANKRIVGQLEGGDSSCSVPNGADTYGRFNRTYPSIQRWIEIGGTINVDSAYTGVEQGTPTQPFHTASAANDFAWNGSRLRFKAGVYPGAITFSKPLTLIATGGTVTIGN